MNNTSRNATIILIACNTFLFGIKIIAGLKSNSLAVISDASNSFTDIISSIIIFIAIRSSSRQADEGHPFGHHRAEPIAGLIVAIFACVLGFEILHASVFKILDAHDHNISTQTFAVLFISIAVKIAMSVYFKKVAVATNSPALQASATDSRNDVYVSTAALVGVAGGLCGYPQMDDIAATLISLWIIRSGYKIGAQNIDYLMGKRPGPVIMEEIRKKAVSVPGVIGIRNVLAHYVGNYIHVEISITLDMELTLVQAHNIGVNVREAVEGIDTIDKAFVHIDPIA